MTKKEDNYWRPIVMFSSNKNDGLKYAIHEGHFDYTGKLTGWTCPVSGEFNSQFELKNWIVEQLSKEDVGVVCGHSQYDYFHEDFELWLIAVNKNISYANLYEFKM